MGAFGLIVDMRYLPIRFTPYLSGLRKETFFALLRRKELLSSSLILPHVVQASKAKAIAGISA
jgi:hypothetical protein